MTVTLTPWYTGLLIVMMAVAGFGALVAWQLYRARARGTYSPLTEDLLRLPGHSLRLEAETLMDRLIELYLRFIGMGVVLAGSLMVHDDGRLRLVAAGAVAIVAVLAVREVPGLAERIRRVSLGRECEEYVGQELNLLMRDGAFVFHDLPYQYGNIDHVVVGHDRVLVVETKGRRKPRGTSGARSRDARVRFDGRTLSFPDHTTVEPLDQARRHAEHVREAIRRQCGFDFPVVPVVALPGWFVESVPYEPGGVLVVNPKRARALRGWLGRRGDRSRADRVACHLDSIARTIAPGSRRTDPDAAEHFDRWMNPRAREPRLG